MIPKFSYVALAANIDLTQSGAPRVTEGLRKGLRKGGSPEPGRGMGSIEKETRVRWHITEWHMGLMLSFFRQGFCCHRQVSRSRGMPAVESAIEGQISKSRR